MRDRALLLAAASRVQSTQAGLSSPPRPTYNESPGLRSHRDEELPTDTATTDPIASPDAILFFGLRAALRLNSPGAVLPEMRYFPAVELTWQPFRREDLNAGCPG